LTESILMNNLDLNNLTILHQKFVDYLKDSGRAHATILAYGKDIEQLIEFVQKNGKNQANQIDQRDIQAFKKHLADKEYAPKTISRKLNSIKTFFRFVKKKDIVEKSPAEEVSHPKYKVKPPRVLSTLEYRALRDVCRDDVRMSAIIELLLQTGIRIGELSSLKIEDIKEDSLIVQPYESHSGRKIPLNKAARAAINRYLAARPQTRSKSLFVTKTGRRFLVRNIRSAINRYFKLANIKDATVNDLRNTFIAHQLKSGMPLTVVSKIAGHKRLVTTEKYLKVIDKPQEKKNSVKIQEL